MEPARLDELLPNVCAHLLGVRDVVVFLCLRIVVLAIQLRVIDVTGGVLLVMVVVVVRMRMRRDVGVSVSVGHRSMSVCVIGLCAQC